MKNYFNPYRKCKSLSCVQPSVTLWSIQSMEFSRPEFWSGQLFPSLGDLPNSGIELKSPISQVDSLPAEPPGKPKNTGVGSLSLLQGIFPTQELNWSLLHCRQILHQLSYQHFIDQNVVLVTKAYQALSEPIDFSLPGSSVQEILQERILEWVAISFSRASSPPRDQTHVSCLVGRFFTSEPLGKPIDQNKGPENLPFLFHILLFKIASVSCYRSKI